MAFRDTFHKIRKYFNILTPEEKEAEDIAIRKSIEQEKEECYQANEEYEQKLREIRHNKKNLGTLLSVDEDGGEYYGEGSYGVYEADESHQHYDLSYRINFCYPKSIYPDRQIDYYERLDWYHERLCRINGKEIDVQDLKKEKYQGIRELLEKHCTPLREQMFKEVREKQKASAGTLIEKNKNGNEIYFKGRYDVDENGKPNIDCTITSFDANGYLSAFIVKKDYIEKENKWTTVTENGKTSAVLAPTERHINEYEITKNYGDDKNDSKTFYLLHDGDSMLKERVDEIVNRIIDSRQQKQQVEQKVSELASRVGEKTNPTQEPARKPRKVHINVREQQQRADFFNAFGMEQ